jgi:hypothetical protein
MGKIFGAYTDIPWKLDSGWKTGNGNSFLFSLRDDSNFVKLRCLKKDREIYDGDLCDFGNGCGFKL